MSHIPLTSLLTSCSFPEEVEIFGILIDYVSGPSPTCLLDNSVAQLTCNSTGFPRPNIRFLKGSEPILPGEVGFERFTQTFPDQVYIYIYIYNCTLIVVYDSYW